MFTTQINQTVIPYNFLNKTGIVTCDFMYLLESMRQFREPSLKAPFVNVKQGISAA